jgi:hypothetical protein
VRLLATVTRIAAAAVLAVGWLLPTVAPARAVDSYGVSKPTAGATVSGLVVLESTVTANSVEEITGVDVGFLRGGAFYGEAATLDHAAGPRTGGTSQWSARLNPQRSWLAGGQPMPNGAYRIQVRVRSAVQGVAQDATEWVGHEVVFDVPAPATTTYATVLSDETGTVEVSWDATTVPDFTRYVVERATNGSGYEPLREIAAPSTTTVVDNAPAGASYAYRVTVHRTGGRGGERASQPSVPATVTIARAAEPSPTEAEPSPSPGASQPADPADPGEPSDPGSPAPSPTAPGVAAAPSPGDAPAAPGLAPSPSDTPRLNLGPRPSGSIRVDSAIAPPPLADVGTGSPQAAPPDVERDLTTFEELLDYGQEIPTNREVTERQVVQVPGTGGVRGGGAIEVFQRDFDEREVLTVVAAGLVLTLTGGHVLRFARARH